jgi:phosphatidylserine decarboxylase
LAKRLRDWIDTDVAEVRDKPLSWLSQHFFFRDPTRPIFSNTSYFYSPADGIVLYQKTVNPDEAIVDIKGKSYSLHDAMRDETYDKESLVIGIFMTFYDVHVNRIPYPGRLLDVEKNLIDDLRINTNDFEYLHNNQRVLNRVFAPDLKQHYYILQVADYDVDSITPFNLKQNQFCAQNERFSQIRYGSQVELIVPVSDRFQFVPVIEEGLHVEAGIDTLIEIHDKLQ